MEILDSVNLFSRISIHSWMEMVLALADYERAKIKYDHLTNNLKKYLPRRHTNNGETGTSNEFDTLANIAVLHEHKLRNNKKPVGEEVQKSINPFKKELFGRSSSDSLEGLSFMKTRI